MERIRRVSDLGIHFFSSYYAVLTGSPVPTMHRWSQFGGQRCASNVHGRGWTSGREECLTRHACRRFAPACSDKENRRFAPVLPGWDEPGTAHPGLPERACEAYPSKDLQARSACPMSGTDSPQTSTCIAARRHGQALGQYTHRGPSCCRYSR